MSTEDFEAESSVNSSRYRTISRYAAKRGCLIGLTSACATTYLFIIATIALRQLQTDSLITFTPSSLYTVPPAPISTHKTPLLELWLESWTDPSLLASSPLGPVLRFAVPALSRWQNPSNCSQSSYLIFRYSSNLGFGANVRHYVAAFHTAIRTGRVLLIDKTAIFYWAKGCPRASQHGQHECFFQPLSLTCPYSRVVALVRDRKLPLTAIDRNSEMGPDNAPIFPVANRSRPDVVHFRVNDRKIKHEHFRPFLFSVAGDDSFATQLAKIAPEMPQDVIRDHLEPLTKARRVWLTCLAYYFLRLNNETARDVYRKLEDLLQTNNPDYSRLIGMPVRGSDKCHGNTILGNGEMECVSVADAMDRVHRVAFASPQISHLILTSEDPSAISEDLVDKAQRNLTFTRPLQVIRNVKDEQPGTGHKEGLITNTPPGVLLQSSLMTLYLQAMAEYHVMTPRSTFHSLIAGMAQTIPGKRHYFMYPLGDWLSLNLSMQSQFM